jgi:tetratricopeptide (TPR) repeat protein
VSGFSRTAARLPPDLDAVKKRKRIKPEPPRHDDFWPLWIFASAVVAYVPVLDGRMLWDDFGHVTLPELRSFRGLWRIWTELGATQQYYPLLHSAFWLEHQLWGDATLGYHLANVALHSTAAVLVVLILRQLAIPGALLAGFIFALHPVAVESVAWISEQKNTLSAVFYLAAAYVYLRSVATRAGGSTEQDPPSVRGPGSSLRRPEPGSPKRVSATAALALPTRHYWLAFALFICALLSKSVTATLPAALLVVLWWKRGRLEWHRDVLPLVPWFAAAVLAGGFTIWFERHVIGAQGDAFGLSSVERVLLAGRVILFYLGKLFWPVNLVFIYPRWSIDGSVWWQYLYPAVAAAIALVLASLRCRGALAGYLFFCGTLVPVLGFVNVYPFLFSYVADHFQYLAALGIITPVATALATAATRLGPSYPRLSTAAVAALVIALAVTTWNRSAAYQNVETLFRDTVEKNPQAWMAWQNLGTELAAQNRFAEAIDAYEGALRARPDYGQARNNLVLAHMRLAEAVADTSDRWPEAIAHYEAVLRVDPNHFRANYNLGTLLMEIPHRHAEAIALLQKAVTIDPKSVEAHVNLGIALADDPSRINDAIHHLTVALAERPDLKVGELLEQLKAGRKADR